MQLKTLVNEVEYNNNLWFFEMISEFNIGLLNDDISKNNYITENDSDLLSYQKIGLSTSILRLVFIGTLPIIPDYLTTSKIKKILKTKDFNDIDTNSILDILKKLSKSKKENKVLKKSLFKILFDALLEDDIKLQKKYQVSSLISTFSKLGDIEQQQKIFTKLTNDIKKTANSNEKKLIEFMNVQFDSMSDSKLMSADFKNINKTDTKNTIKEAKLFLKDTLKDIKDEKIKMEYIDDDKYSVTLLSDIDMTDKEKEEIIQYIEKLNSKIEKNTKKDKKKEKEQKGFIQAIFSSLFGRDSKTKKQKVPVYISAPLAATIAAMIGLTLKFAILYGVFGLIEFILKIIA